MHDNLYTGTLVRLRASNPESDSALFSRWSRNSEYTRMLDSDPGHLWSAKITQEWMEKYIEEGKQDDFFFIIELIEDSKAIGFVDLNSIRWQHGDCYVGIGIGEADCWSKGYGSEAMDLVVGYAFRELNLRRVSLTVFDYNPRGLRSYEKVGFRVEGRQREFLHRDGRRFDMIFMGILREEWFARQQARKEAQA